MSYAGRVAEPDKTCAILTCVVTLPACYLSPVAAEQLLVVLQNYFQRIDSQCYPVWNLVWVWCVRHCSTRCWAFIGHHA